MSHCGSTSINITTFWKSFLSCLALASLLQSRSCFLGCLVSISREWMVARSSLDSTLSPGLEMIGHGGCLSGCSSAETNFGGETCLSSLVTQNVTLLAGQTPSYPQHYPIWSTPPWRNQWMRASQKAYPWWSLLALCPSSHIARTHLLAPSFLGSTTASIYHFPSHWALTENFCPGGCPLLLYWG